MPGSDAYKKRISDIQHHIKKTTGEEVVCKPRRCISVNFIVGIIAVPIIFMILYFLQPGFCQKLEGDKFVRSMPKTILWTVIISAILWVMLYLLNYCNGWNGGEICF